MKSLDTFFFETNLSTIANEYGLQLKRITFYRHNNTLHIELGAKRFFVYDTYALIKDFFYGLTGANIDLCIFYDNPCDMPFDHVLSYLDQVKIEQQMQRVFQNSTPVFDQVGYSLIFKCIQSLDEQDLQQIQTALIPYGLIDLTVRQEIRQLQINKEIPSVNMVVKPEVKEPVASKKKYIKPKMENYTLISLKDATQGMSDIQFIAEVFKIDMIEIKKTGRIIQTISVFDGTDAINIKRFESRLLTREEMDEVHQGDRIQVFGKFTFDSFSNELICEANRIDILPKIERKDEADQKRIEFHMHTNMSEMDGVCDVKEVVSYAYELGHEGIVITDHADVQSFVKAYNQAKSLKKKDPNRPFKVGLGCEMNMVNDALTIVRQPNLLPLDDQTYIIFDLETTGLSCYFDHMIEFGGVKVKNQQIVDRLQLFIKPPVSIPPFIASKTNITNDMVKDAKTFQQEYQRILNWIGDGILVAHNATFDFYFMNEELKRIGQPPLTNPVIDTLDMARAILKDRRAYRLGNIARYYHVSYNEEQAHRADFDAEVLYSVFTHLLKDAKEIADIQTLVDLQEKIQDEQSFVKMRHSHVCVIAKNQKGLKALYQLVSLSNTSSLAVMGKATGKEGSDVAAEARIQRSILQANREHLLLGSSCLNGEVFELAANGDDERLRQAIEFYDYIEVQPIGNYSTLLAMGSIPSKDRLKKILKRIIDMAKACDKPLIADSDAHYCTPEQKIFRDVYICAQGVGGAIHPLYIRDDALRLATPNPDQHIRLTNEMMQEFAWLQDEALIQEMVIDTPKQLFDQIEEVRPVPDGTYPPFIEGSDDQLRQICFDTAMQMYGFQGKIPEIVTQRLNEELDNIIRNGFGVHYYIAHLLVKHSNEDGYVVGSRGSVGSSFTATMAKITEVNPLKPHYLCPHCHYSEFIDDVEVSSGFDLPDKPCPHCQTMMHGQGHNIPFQTFLGFNADKTPDIDLNFSNEYQWRAHAFIKDVFGEQHAFRAGTIGTVAEKTAYGYVAGYTEKMHLPQMRRAMKEYLALHTQNVKRTTGQHPGGIIIIPKEYDAEDFTPVQYPANDPTSAWKTTHYDFHDIHDNVLKFDILGHVDPTAMRLLENIADVKPMDIPMNDPETLSLFYDDHALKADPRLYKKETGALGLPEFGTRTTRNVLEETRPKKFSELVIISGLSHGTDVWAGNAQELVRHGHGIGEVIGCRDDIMTYLMDKQLEPLDAFKIMEDVRKGKGVKPEYEEKMRANHVPDWYIDSCKKIKYMFPKAHAVAYVMMAMRIAWYKVHEPLHFYIQYFSLRCDAYEIETMARGLEAVRMRMQDIQMRLATRDTNKPVSNKEKNLYDTLEVCEELYARGFKIGMVSLQHSKAKEFIIDPQHPDTIIPPFVVMDGLGENVATSIEEARNQAPFISKEDLQKRTQVSTTLLKKLDDIGCLEGLQESNQMSLFNF